MSKKKSKTPKLVVIDVSSVSGTLSTLAPQQAPLNVNDTISWNNLTGRPIVVFFPHDGILGNNGPIFCVVPKDRTSAPMTAVQATPAVKYAIFCFKTMSFAIGSDPEIIVQ